jgi:TonB family protein
MKILLAFPFLLLTFSASAQTIQYYTKYYQPTPNKLLAETYTETVTSDSLIAYVKTYSVQGVLQQEANYINLKKKLLNGVSKSWYENGKLKSELLYKNGKLNGPLKSYHKNGQLKRHDLYRANKFIEGKCFSTTGADTTYFPFAAPPVFPGGERALMKYLVNNLKISDEARKKNIQGKVIVRFEVDETGKIADITFLEKAHPEYNREVLRVIGGMPNWQPGIHDGEKVKTLYTLPVNFNPY